MPRQPQNRRRVMSAARIHASRCRDIMRQKRGRHRRMGVKISHTACRHRHMVMIKAMIRRKTTRPLHMPLGVHVRSYGRNSGRRRPVLRVGQA